MIHRLLLVTLLMLPSWLIQGKTASPLHTISDIRAAYAEAIHEAPKAAQFHKRMAQLNTPSPLKLGYKGAAKTLKAKHSWNPVKKMRYLKQGMNLIGQAIRKKPSDIELRFLRLSVAYYLPDFLGYGENMKTDKSRILKGLLGPSQPRKPPRVRTVILEFLCQNDLCNESEKQALKALMKE